jgi:hypothetical protein
VALQRRPRAATEYAKIGGTGHMTADVSRRIVGLTPLRGDRQPSPKTRARTAATADTTAARAPSGALSSQSRTS